MATIGTFKKTGNNEFNGEIVTLSLQTKNVRIVPEARATGENAPSHRVFVGRAEIGAAWSKTSNEGRAQAALKPVMAALGSTVKVETEAGLAKLSLVGIGMRSHSGVGATAFKALADANIKTGMISTSEIKIAVMVDESDIEEAARVVHRAFNLGV